MPTKAQFPDEQSEEGEFQRQANELAPMNAHLRRFVGIIVIGAGVLLTSSCSEESGWSLNPEGIKTQGMSPNSSSLPTTSDSASAPTP
jgi:hypothetical protein